VYARWMPGLRGPGEAEGEGRWHALLPVRHKNTRPSAPYSLVTASRGVQAPWCIRAARQAPFQKGIPRGRRWDGMAARGRSSGSASGGGTLIRILLVASDHDLIGSPAGTSASIRY
jgi:hypothetical protein